MIRIIDYGLGNVLAFLNAYKRMNVPCGVASSAEHISDATKLILPGVGAFDHAMSMLSRSGMRDAVERRVLGDRIPIVGVCVGMQMLASRSDEGKLAGLGWIDAEVRGFSGWGRSDLRLPHMGWNDVVARPTSALFADLHGYARFYFLHSYYFAPVRVESVAAVATYGEEFCCAVSAENVHGVQFHPEKSHECGMRLLRNFAGL
jgi:imidazole glycerol-phosphate synthase subunit HisH